MPLGALRLGLAQWITLGVAFLCRERRQAKEDDRKAKRLRCEEFHFDKAALERDADRVRIDLKEQKRGLAAQRRYERDQAKEAAQARAAVKAQLVVCSSPGSPRFQLEWPMRMAEE